MEPLRKQFPVFDCDAHVNDHLDIWRKYVPESERELVRASYWVDERQALLNGERLVIGGQDYDFFPMYNPIAIAGPGMNRKLMRRLQHMSLTAEQRRYLSHPGAYDPHARLKEMDLMGIDQVMVIPTMLVQNFHFIRNAEGARALARAYNDWARDYCAAAPDRLFAAAWLPLQNLDYA